MKILPEKRGTFGIPGDSLRREPSRRRAWIWIIVFLFLILAISAMVEFQIDPVRQFFRSDGSLSLHGQISGVLLNYLMRGPSTTTQERGVRLIDRAGGTMAWEATILESPTAAPRIARSFAPVDWRGLRVRFDEATRELRGFIAYALFGWWSGTASAACTGGNCFYIGGDGNFSSSLHWSLTSGGLTCACTPGSTDTVTFDASSGAGTATQDNTTFTSGAVTMTSSSVTVAGSSNTWKVGGSWSNTGTDHFSMGTSTVQFTATGNINANATGGDVYFYNVTVDASVVSTQQIETGISRILTVNGTWTISGAGTFVKLWLLNNGGSTDPLTVGGSGSVTSGGNGGNIVFFNQSGSTVNVPGLNYTGNTKLQFEPFNTVTAPGVQFKLLGSITANLFLFVQFASKPFYVNSQTFDVTLVSSTSISDSPAGASSVGIVATSGTWILSGAVSFSDATNSAGYYIKFGASVWTIGGAWTNVSTNSTDWSVGTSSVIFNSAVSRAITPANFAASEFNNLTFDSTAAGSTAITYTQTSRTLRWAGALTIQQTGASSGTTTLATTDLGLIGGSATVANKAVLTANASTVAVTNVTMTGGTSGTITLSTGGWVVSGNWNTSGAGSIFTKGSASTVTMSGASKTLATLNASNGFGTLTISGTVTQTTNIDVSAQLGVTGTLTTAGFAVSGGADLLFASSGTMTATTSTLTVHDVDLNGGVLSFTSASATVSGVWDSSGSTFTYGTSTVTMTGASKTITAATFYNLQINGTESLAADLVVAHDLTIPGTLDFTASNYSLQIDHDLTVTGTLNGRGSIITMNGGDWDTSAGTFSYVSPSLIRFFGVSNLDTAPSAGGGTFYNVLVTVSGSVTLNNAIGIDGVLTLHGPLVMSGMFTLYIRNVGVTTDPLVITSGSLTSSSAAPNISQLEFFIQQYGAGALINVPSGTYTQIQLVFSPSVAASGFGTEFRILGNVTAYSVLFSPRTGAPFYINSQTYNVTLNIPQPTYPALFDSPINSGVKFGIQATSGTWTIGAFLFTYAGDEGFYIKFGASNWTILGGTYTNSTTTNSTDWSAGTGTVTFTIASNVVYTFATGLGATPEFNNVTFDANAAADPIYIMGSALLIAGTLLLRNSAGSPYTTTLDVTTSNYQIKAAVIQGSQIDNNGLLRARAGTILTKTWNFPRAGYAPTCFLAAPPCLTPAIVQFYGDGTIFGKGNLAGDFWDVVIDAGVTTTLIGNYLGDTTGIGIQNQFTVNGTYHAGSSNQPYWQTNVRGQSRTANPLVFGVSADVSLSGYIVIRYDGGATYNVPGAAYQNLAVEGVAGVTVQQTGGLATNQTPAAQCGAVVSLCELIILQTTPGNTFVYNTNGYSIDVGVLFLGDTNLEGLTFNAGSSTISCHEFAALETAIINLQSSTLDVFPAYSYSPVAWIQERQAQVYGGTATINIHGAFRLWPFPLGQPGNNAGFHAQGATVNVLADGLSGTCAIVFGATRCPGDVFVDEDDYYIDLGSSTWFVAGSWKNSSTSLFWSAGTGTVTFTGIDKTYSQTDAARGLGSITVSGRIELLTPMTFSGLFQTAGDGSIRTGTAVQASGWSIANGAGGVYTIESIVQWDAGAIFKWTFSATGTAPLTIHLLSTATGRFWSANLDGLQIATGTVIAGEIIFEMPPGSSDMQVDIDTVFTEGLIVSGFVLFVFMAVLILAVMGAVWLRHRFS